MYLLLNSCLVKFTRQFSSNRVKFDKVNALKNYKMKVDKNNIIENKKRLRVEIKERQRELGDVYMNDAAEKIARLLRKMPEYKEAKTVMMYVSVGKEVITNKMMLFALKQDKKVCLPLCIDTENYLMEAKLWNEKYRLEKGAYGIPTPSEDAPTINAEDIDLVVLPCVSCDKECNRLGHGAGYYDRFIEKLRADCGKIALCYEKILADNIPVESHDVKMDAVITEEKIYRR